MLKRVLCVVVSLAIIIAMLASCMSKATDSTDSKCDEPAQYIMDIGDEEYAHVEEGTFHNASKEHLSTFSIDVDTGSYANVRRMLNDGELPYPDAVRVEECINYFSYEPYEPEGDMPFAINVEMAECPWEKNNYLAMVALHARDVDKTDVAPSNFVFLIDVSGSMDSRDKLPLLKSGFKMLVDSLSSEDIVSIVTYSGNVSVKLDSVSGDNKDIIKSVINKLGAGGSTAGGRAMEMAYDIALDNYIDGGNNRIIMATDGDFNVGISSENQLERFIEKKRDEGVFLSILGFGTGNIKDNKMELLADKGNGNYSYIDSAQEAKKVLVEEMHSTMYTLAKDVKLQVEFNPKNVEEYRLIGYDNRVLNKEDYNNDKKDAGELGIGDSVIAFYEIVPKGVSTKVDPLRYSNSDENDKEESESDDSPYQNEWMYVKARYKKPDSTTSEDNIELAVSFDDITDNPSADFLFASAVCEFAMILKQSEYCDGSMEDVVRRAKLGKGYDENGYRAEFIRLAGVADSMLD